MAEMASVSELQAFQIPETGVDDIAAVRGIE